MAAEEVSEQITSVGVAHLAESVMMSGHLPEGVRWGGVNGIAQRG